MKHCFTWTKLGEFYVAEIWFYNLLSDEVDTNVRLLVKQQ